MAPRSKLARLPQAALAEVERHITEQAYGGYRELSRSLKSQGHDISEDSLQRHGARLKRELETMQYAAYHSRMLGDAAPDPETMVDSILQLLHVRLLSALTDETQLERSDFALLRAANHFNRLVIARQRSSEMPPAKPSRGYGRNEQSQSERKISTEEDYLKMRNALFAAPDSSIPEGAGENIASHADVRFTQPAPVTSSDPYPMTSGSPHTIDAESCPVAGSPK